MCLNYVPSLAVSVFVPHCFVCLLSSLGKKAPPLLLNLSLKSAFPNTSFCSLSSPFIPLFILIYTSGKILLWNQVDLVRNLGWSVHSTSLSFSLFLLFLFPFSLLLLPFPLSSSCLLWFRLVSNSPCSWAWHWLWLFRLLLSCAGITGLQVGATTSSLTHCWRRYAMNGWINAICYRSALLCREIRGGFANLRQKAWDTVSKVLWPNF